jgi:hypothetical protein
MLGFLVSVVFLATCGGILAGLIERRFDWARVPARTRRH